ERELSIEYGKVTGGEERLALFNRHRSERELGDHAASEEDLRSFLLESSVETIELRIQNAGRLVCIAIADLGRESINAVYTYFDSREKRFSLGTLAVLELIRFARQTQRRFVYLGLFVADCRHLNYKARFWPQERRLNGEWLRFDTAD
ncbi:MAG: arginyltransferase, partial [Planctomycetota bacterium]